MLERVELSNRVRTQLERFFGPDGLAIVGSGMSTDVFTPLYRIDSQIESLIRKRFSSSLDAKRDDMLQQDYLAVVGRDDLDPVERRRASSDPEIAGREMWRISIRLAALNDVDYGQFVNDMKRVVEPIQTAYRFRTEILKELQAELGDSAVDRGKVLVLAHNPDNAQDDIHAKAMAGATMNELIDQTFIFSDTLQDLLENRGIADSKEKEKPSAKKYYKWLDPDRNNPADPKCTPEQREVRERFFEPERFAAFLKSFDCVVLVEDDPLFDVELIKANSRRLVDCRDHHFDVDPRSNLPKEGEWTAMERKKAGEHVEIATIYTGIVPIVYKAQRALAQSR